MSSHFYSEEVVGGHLRDPTIPTISKHLKKASTWRNPEQNLAEECWIYSKVTQCVNLAHACWLELLLRCDLPSCDISRAACMAGLSNRCERLQSWHHSHRPGERNTPVCPQTPFNKAKKRTKLVFQSACAHGPKEPLHVRSSDKWDEDKKNPKLYTREREIQRGWKWMGVKRQTAVGPFLFCFFVQVKVLVGSNYVKPCIIIGPMGVKWLYLIFLTLKLLLRNFFSSNSTYVEYGVTHRIMAPVETHLFIGCQKVWPCNPA